MGVIQPELKFKLDDKTNGICMQGYYGGRAEIRIRHTPVPLVYTDFLSQYPTVNTLLGLWPLLTARKLRIRDSTRDVRTFQKSITLDELHDPKTWRNLRFFALVQPNADVLPVRAVYGDNRIGNETNIGLNPLISEKPIWFAVSEVCQFARSKQSRHSFGIPSNREGNGTQLGAG